MVLKGILAKIGIGSARIDTVIHTEAVQPGAFLQGEVRIQGGEVEQPIDRIEFFLEVDVPEEETGMTHQLVILAEHLSGSFKVNPREQKSIPFQIKIPYETPLNRVLGFQLPIALNMRTSLSIPGAVDPGDRDPINVEPNPAQTRILEAMKNLGMQIFKADLEPGQAGSSVLPFYQELEFYPPPYYRNRVSEVELTFVAREGDMDVILEFDKKSRGISRLAYHSIDEVRGFKVSYADFDKTDWESVIEKLMLR